MTKHVFIFLGTFVVGAIIALTVRATRFDAHAATGHAVISHPAPATPVANSAPAAIPDHAAHTTTNSKPVNTVCAICGMDVDPDLPTATYQGKTIGFGCKACPAKFTAQPDKYGPAYLRNERAK